MLQFKKHQPYVQKRISDFFFFSSIYDRFLYLRKIRATKKKKLKFLLELGFLKKVKQKIHYAVGLFPFSNAVET